MTYHTIGAVIQRWVDIAEGTSDVKQLTNSRAPVFDGKLYAWSVWFELVRARRDKKGRVTHYIVNGDLLPRNGWQGGSHQWALRQALQKMRTAIIPFSALAEAGIDLDTVQIIHVLPDRNEEIRHHSDTFPAGAVWHNDPIYETRELTEETKAEWSKHHWYGLHNPSVPIEQVPLAYRHWTVSVGKKQVLRTGRSPYRGEIAITRNDDGTKSYDWTTSHHWLGESLIRARVTWRNGVADPRRFNRADFTVHHRWAYFLSGFDHQEPTPLYFFAELPPRVKPTTVDEAYTFLKPEPVLLAEQMERAVTRQGDIFAVETSLTTRALTKQGAVYEKRLYTDTPSWWGQRANRVQTAQLLGTNHCATEVARLPGGITLARGSLYHDPIGRRRDHVRRRIGDGKTWHIIVKNTVPNTTGRR